MTLSTTDLHQNDLLPNIFKLERQNICDEKITNMSYFGKCEILNKNSVFVACHFQLIRVEFQFRGSPHIHSFLWILNPVKLSKETNKEYLVFLDQTINSFLPNQTADEGLYDLGKLYQTHQHPKLCRKYNLKPCCYSFHCFFTNRNKWQ